MKTAKMHLYQMISKHTLLIDHKLITVFQIERYSWRCNLRYQYLKANIQRENKTKKREVLLPKILILIEAIQQPTTKN